MTKHEFEVAMTCEGCSGAVSRVLGKLGGDVKFEIDLPKKLVWIESDKDVDFLMDTLKKCGKDVKYNGTK
ncbi:copper transport protein ATOX1 [Lampris incognitus]|uniref:copper transport protein ATOX1 n=1 Tax=Lampris incognitus TaxID=2546036 RepID=UPI0024B4D4FD|nr:copper transport protein ATOX1 [Lampris incognitus]XP_056140480.1 copper transport protein ATOX1 [Lampris incognitus]